MVILKSGVDFQSFSEILLFKGDKKETECGKEEAVVHENVCADKPYTYNLKGDLSVSITKRDITLKDEEDPEIKAKVDFYNDQLQETMKKNLFKIDQECDLTFCTIRRCESAFANIINDLFRKETSADCSILSSGCIRSDYKFPKGHIYTYGDVNDAYPMDKDLCVKEVTGEALFEAFENGVSQYPVLDGRFPKVSNIYFEWDATKPAGQRVNKDSVIVAGAPLCLAHKYKVAMCSYLGDGRDGYTSFKNAPFIIEPEILEDLRNMVIKFFSKF